MRNALLMLMLLTSPAASPEGDWKATAGEAAETLSRYIRFDTTVPPGDVTEAAAFLQGIFEREGLAVERYQAAPGKVTLVARLKAEGRPVAKPILLLHHMDVVPADASRWDGDPFGGVGKDGPIGGRGAMDMKGTGTLQLYAFLTLARQKAPLEREVILMVVPDEEIGGGLGARFMIENHYDKLDPEYVLDEGGFGTREVSGAGRLVFGISVAEKQIVWLEATAEGVAGHGSQPNDQNPNDKLVKALSRFFAEPFPSASNPVLQTLRSEIGEIATNQL